MSASHDRRPSPRRRHRLSAFVAIGAVAVTSLIAVGITNAAYNDHGQYNYAIRATTPPVAGNGVPTKNYRNVQSFARQGGTLYGWGSVPALTGTGWDSNVPLPVQIPAGTTFVEIAAGPEHNLAVDQNGDMWSWGTNLNGALGYAGGAQTTPKKITGLPVKFKKVAAGGRQNLGVASAPKASVSLALDVNGNLWTWGAWSGGASTQFMLLGDGSRADRTTPKQITTGTRFIDIASGWEKQGAVAADGSVYMWGSNHLAGLALESNETTNVFATPTKVNPTWLSNIKQLQFGGQTSYALDNNGQAWAWGSSQSGSAAGGQLGIGDPAIPPSPYACIKTGALSGSACRPIKVKQDVVRYTSLSAGESAVYALDTTGTAWSWGSNRFGNTGNGTGGGFSDTLEPAKVSIPGTVVGVTAEYFGGVAVDSTGGIWTWGRIGMNNISLLGNDRTASGSTDMQKSPVKIK